MIAAHARTRQTRRARNRSRQLHPELARVDLHTVDGERAITATELAAARQVEAIFVQWTHYAARSNEPVCERPLAMWTLGLGGEHQGLISTRACHVRTR
jgi:hypothetical protein